MYPFAGQMPLRGDVRVEGRNNVLLLPFFQLKVNKSGKTEWLLPLSDFGMEDFIIPKFEKTFGKSGDIWGERCVCAGIAFTYAAEMV